MQTLALLLSSISSGLIFGGGWGGGCSNKSRCAASPWRAAPPNVAALVPGGKKRGQIIYSLNQTPVEDSLKTLHLIICPVSFRPRGCFAESADGNEIVQVVAALA